MVAEVSPEHVPPAPCPACLDPALPADEAWSEAVATEASAALQWLEASRGADTATRIHQCRRASKRLRALLRLGEPAAAGALREMRRWVAAAARDLAPGRDAEVAARTLDGLLDRYAGGLDAPAFVSLRDALHARAPEVVPEHAVLDAGTTLESVLEALQEPEAPAPDDDALQRGLTVAWRRAHRQAAQVLARGDDDPECWHRLRSHVLVVMNQLRAVRELTGGALRNRERRLKRLGTLLGSAHDRAMLSQRLADGPEAAAVRPLLLALLDAEEQGFYRRARPLVQRLFQRPSSRFERRLTRHWRLAG